MYVRLLSIRVETPKRIKHTEIYTTGRDDTHDRNAKTIVKGTNTSNLHVFYETVGELKHMHVAILDISFYFNALTSFYF